MKKNEYIRNRIEELGDYKNLSKVPELVEMTEELVDAFGMKLFEDILSVIKKSKLYLEATESESFDGSIIEAENLLKNKVLGLLAKEKSLHNIGLDFDSLLHLTDSTEIKLIDVMLELVDSKKVKLTSQDTYKLV